MAQGLFRFRHLAAQYVGGWTSKVEAERGLVSTRHIRRSVVLWHFGTFLSYYSLSHTTMPRKAAVEDNIYRA